MTADKIYKTLDSLFPFSKSNEYIEKFGGFDNSGIILNCENNINNALWALDFSKKSINAAKELNCNLIITHHPAVYTPINTFLKNDYNGGLILKAVQANISVISMHLNLDAAQNGMDFELEKIFSSLNSRIVQKIDGGGYGRIITFNKINSHNLNKKIENELKTNKIRFYGEGEISKAAIFSGSGFAPEVFAEKDLNLIVSSEIKHHYLVRARDCGICVADIPHYASENYSFKKIYTKTKDCLGIKSHYFEDDNLL